MLRSHGLQQGPDVVHRLRGGDENRIAGFPRDLVIVMLTINAANGQTLMRAKTGFSRPDHPLQLRCPTSPWHSTSSSRDSLPHGPGMRLQRATIGLKQEATSN